MGEFSFVLLSGGIGKRMQVNIPKQFLLLGGKPILVHILEKIDLIESIKEIIIPSPKEFIHKTEEIIRNYGFSTPIHCIEGGATRQESVYLALKSARFDQVIVHEAVRPFVTKEEFINLINAGNESAIYGLDIPFTVLEGKDFIENNLVRDQLINIQLPQKFNRNKLLYAHECAREESMEFTEDASLFFHFFKTDIKVLKGSDYNIKITKPVDRKIAEVLYKEYILMEE
ncbi:IspD/TarI family cytidylyltransferase [Heyndrickxia sp. NPDC080065]|uniref:IspD/TarI family cytidylyltransferase n=1 Tax=Heyndrickxia sp. NPDC080065 TaxID=3390568 RepID=UPI003D077706